MHAQAAFIPSYDTVNFNTLPALPALLGLSGHLISPRLVSATELIRFISLLPLLF